MELGNPCGEEKCLTMMIKEWYFVTKIVLTYCEKKCPSDQENVLKFKAEGQKFEIFLRSLEQFIQTVKVLVTCSWRFLMSDKLEQLECKLEKNIGI